MLVKVKLIMQANWYGKLLCLSMQQNITQVNKELTLKKIQHIISTLRGLPLGHKENNNEETKKSQKINKCGKKNFLVDFWIF